MTAETAQPDPTRPPSLAGPPNPAARIPVWPFFAWALVGVVDCVALFSVFTIGVFVLPVGIAASIPLLLWRGSRTIAAVGVISGLGLVPLYIAYLNRGGPGDVCSTSSVAQSCMTESSPWPWLAAGVLMVAVGVAVFVRVRSRISPSSAGP